MYKQAKQFITQFYTENGYATDEADHRLKQIKREIDLTGTYTLSLEELTYGAQLAWRNSNKCIGRLFWKTLDVIDHQQLIQEEDIFQALFSHIQFATNSGKIRPLITIFSKQVRIWNHQLIRYAGYETEKGIVGDPDSVAFTKICQQLGWKGHGGSFDVLPLVVQVGLNKPVWREISSEIVLEVPIRHPEYQWFTSLGLKWYAVPIISSMKLEIGGHVFPAAPFNGWYMGTEIGARNLADEQRYDQLPIIAEKIGLNCSSASTLWKDRALVELNRAVLYSFKEDRVSIVDHHTAAKQFQQFEKQEAQEGRIVTGNWTWLIPPLSPATTHIFHRPYPNDIVTPNFFYQKAPYENELE